LVYVTHYSLKEAKTEKLDPARYRWKKPGMIWCRQPKPIKDEVSEEKDTVF
jgi:hypothetical protein